MHFKSLIRERKSNFLVIIIIFLITEIFGDKRFFVILKK